MHRLLPTTPAPDGSLINELTTAAAFDHPAGKIEMVETHISWVILTDTFAYKIKKPIRLDFLDFSDLDKRHHYCEEEIRLNKPWAPDLYVGVVAITRENEHARFGGRGEPIEYAVQMHRFAQHLQLDQQLQHEKLTVADMKEVARAIATRHQDAPLAATQTRARYLEKTREFVDDNFTVLEKYTEIEQASSLSQWSTREMNKVEQLLQDRFDEGYVRDCHGDLHLANLVRLPSGITCFDCIEFDPDLRRIDVICDAAFLVMDLVSRQRHDLASHFLNRYLECTGDYYGVALLDLFVVYRSLVRAKVQLIGAQERSTDEANRYLDIARRQAHKPPPVLIVMHGVSGCGKTWLSEKLMAALPAIRMRSDIERKREYGLAETAESHSDVGRGIYAKRANERLYARLFSLAKSVLDSGHNVILDAAFLQRERRAEAYAVAKECGCEVALLRLDAPIDELHSRLVERAANASDASEAGRSVLDHQLRTMGPLSVQDKKVLIDCGNSADIDIANLVTQIARRRANYAGASQ